jgi:hypothetical protein
MNWLNLMPASVVLGLARHFLTTMGGGLVTSGVLTDGDLQTGIGAVLALLGIGLSILDKKKPA